MSTTSNQSASKADAAKDQASQVSANAQEKAGEVAGTAKEQAGQVATQAKEHAQQLAGETADQLNTQAGQQSQRLAGTLGELSDQLATMSDAGEPGTTAHTVVSEIADRSGRLSDYLASTEPRDVLRDVQDFGRRRPGAFIAGMALAGLVVGRLGKAAKNAPDSSSAADGAGATAAPTTPVVIVDDLPPADFAPGGSA